MWDKIQFVYVWLPYCVTNFSQGIVYRNTFQKKKIKKEDEKKINHNYILMFTAGFRNVYIPQSKCKLLQNYFIQFIITKGTDLYLLIFDLRIKMLIYKYSKMYS